MTVVQGLADWPNCSTLPRRDNALVYCNKQLKVQLNRVSYSTHKQSSLSKHSCRALPKQLQPQQGTLERVREGSELRSAPESKGDYVLFFVHTLCPYAQRVWLTLLEKGVPFEMVHIDLANKPAWYRSVNPRGLVPVVLYRGEIVTESLDICRWVDGTFEGPHLMPADPEAARKVNALIREGESLTQAGLSCVAGNDRPWAIGQRQFLGQQQAFEEAVSRAIAAPLKASGGPFLAGAQLTLADLVLMPFMERFAAALQLNGIQIADLRFCGVAAAGWMAAVGGREAYRITAADPQLLQEAFRRHRSLDFFDYDSYSVFELHPHNR